VGRLALACLLVLAAACSSSRGPALPDARAGKGFYHELATGETVWQLSQRYGIPVEAILLANRIEDPRHLAPGMRIFVPGVRPLPGDEAPPLEDMGPLVRGCTPSEALRQELTELLGPNGVFLYPSYTRPAPLHHEPLMRPLDWIYTAIGNVLQMPITQVPLGLSTQGLPLGVQVGARSGNDAVTIAVAIALEKAFGGWIPPKNLA